MTAAEVPIREERHAALARAILDGSRVDWAAVHARADPAECALLESLELLADVLEAHRRLPPIETSTRVPSETHDGSPRWGHLRVLERIGGGAFGDVYRAWDETLDREVALKLLPVCGDGGADGGREILEEGRALARVRHPSVVTIYGAEVIGDQVGLWMERVQGRTLEEMAREGRRWSAEEAAALGAELCRAVAAVHNVGLVHRDVKASNVMVADDGRVVLMDFGSGLALDGAGAPLAGTPLYLAPELFTGGEPGRRSDVYSVGVLLFHLLTGSYPVTAQDARGLQVAHQRGERRGLRTVAPEVPAPLARVVERALDPLAERRHPTAEALGADLAAVAGRPRRAALIRRSAVAAVSLLALAVASWQLRARLPRDLPTGARASTVVARDGISVPAAGIAANEDHAATPVIVVLPFDNLGRDASTSYLADGLAEEILRDLARVDGLTVRSRFSSFSFRGPARDLRTIGERLSARFALTGSVARSGDRLRVAVQLVDIENDRPLWADRFDRTLSSSSDLFSLVDEIARRIVNELRLSLGAGRRRYDIDIDAYERYLRARELVSRRGHRDPHEAIAILDELIEEDASFAPAHAALADANASLSQVPYHTGVPPAEALERMRSAAARAIEIDPLLAEAHAAIGVARARDRDWSRAAESFERALSLDRTLTLASAGYSFHVLRPLHRYAEAEQLLESALANDPLSPDLEREIAALHFTIGRYDEAIERLERLYAVDPGLAFVGNFLGRALVFSGRAADGLAVLVEDGAAGRSSPDWRCHALVMLGRRAEAEQIAADNAAFPLRQVVAYAALGELDRALAALDRAIEREPQRVPIFLTFPELAPLAGDPRLAVVRRRLGLH